MTMIAIAEVYLWIGAAVAAVFLSLLGRFDEDARGAWVFRPLLVPGVLLLWPLVLLRWGLIEAGATSWRGRHRPILAAHAPVWIVIAAAAPLIVILALVLKQDPPTVEPIRIEAPR